MQETATKKPRYFERYSDGVKYVGPGRWQGYGIRWHRGFVSRRQLTNVFHFSLEFGGGGFRYNWQIWRAFFWFEVL